MKPHLTWDQHARGCKRENLNADRGQRREERRGKAAPLIALVFDDTASQILHAMSSPSIFSQLNERFIVVGPCLPIVLQFEQTVGNSAEEQRGRVEGSMKQTAFERTRQIQRVASSDSAFRA
jgi:hypothetical protein